MYGTGRYVQAIVWCVAWHELTVWVCLALGCEHELDDTLALGFNRCTFEQYRNDRWTGRNIHLRRGGHLRGLSAHLTLFPVNLDIVISFVACRKLE